MNTWIVTRAAGLGAYLMLFAAVAWGLLATTTLVSRRISKATSILLHQVLASVGLALLAIHLVALLLDRFVDFDALDLIVPLRSEERPLAVGLGVLAMYAGLVVLVTSWARKPLGTTWWRRFHLLATPAFALALAHGMAVGSDTRRPWMWWLYVATALVLVFLLVVRALAAGRGRDAERHDPGNPSRARGSTRPGSSEDRGPVSAGRRG
jgi:sulfoxide reductase heme-binding subunit YedZ